MLTLRPIRALFVGLAVLVVLPRPALCQPIGAAPATYQSESQLLTQITNQPRMISSYLDLAKLYFEQRRLEEAGRMLMRAMTLIDQERRAGGPPQAPLPIVPSFGAGPASAQAPVRVGGGVIEPRKIRDVKPVYPPIAQAAGVQGLVIVETIIDQQGHVKDAKVLRSVPLLDQAALDAVRQWQFTPTLLNMVPVEVIMTMTVNFSLSSAGTGPMRIGGGVREPQKIVDAKPVYPPDAQAARVSGLVIIEVVIDEQGNVATARVLRSVALLDQAALDAVKQWKFTPTIVNGAAVPVVMTVTVNFTLQ